MRTIRATNPHQASTGTACSSGGRFPVLDPYACHPGSAPSGGGGGFHPFSWIGHEVMAHWRGIAQVGFTTLGVLGGGACIVLTEGLGTMGCLAAAGSLTSMANKAVSGGPITLKGMATAGLEGALTGEIAYGCLDACGGIVGAALVNLGAGTAVSVLDYAASTNWHPTVPGVEGAVLGGSLDSGPYPGDELFRRLIGEAG